MWLYPLLKLSMLLYQVTNTQESLWLQRFFADLTKKPTKFMVIYEDNQSAITMEKDLHFHFIRTIIAIWLQSS